ncbi:MAG TPA: hypothetical protein VGQ76_23065 [Thermoanaerobaculia bacterium]|jgi:hypothetical protein|nr:hypothetical protein [Thermoanaerobaculia bacterium]
MHLFLAMLLLATLGNADVVKLVKAGLSPETIEAKIASSETDFDTSTDALVALAGEGVPDRVIRAMIEHEKPAIVAPVPPVPPTPPAPPAAPRALARRYDVTVHADGGGKCEAELRVDGKGVKLSRCRALDFTLAWGELDSVCYTYGFRGEVVLKTAAREHRISLVTPAEAKRLVEHLLVNAPKVPVAECR